ncbi:MULTISPECIES: hypothetical protein [Paenibacillus]|uniref:hypothetical protein n=1 Tax=Paenibacillus TaxID=44249 RepID=UPI000FBE3CE6|nr:hypothetical protein [Paenibacillus sp. Lou8.1]MCF2718049.1 hypothetical protein [Paenibacillus sp. UKAQ_18]MCP3810087.1 hypothetical protein [Paenibacillus sp. Lou8.1]
MNSVVAEYMYFDGPREKRKSIGFQTELNDETEIEEQAKKEAAAIVGQPVKIIRIKIV